ncbi:histidine phosphatase family protein [Pseudobutyrivibrio xylanivorans]|uniref:Probable phosphoglycerate mutase n=1 Tax=Pseudobutyrivibrio xylanivorans TaxID=185007 RepID=A0A1G5S1T1_PSEXY|nr:histidine phosphatase family protein [Pseudobutyrivibrio xylanivorans]SCZ80324.1 probable phosphoglycerate mutase [Pseudobutyrivibrio xylanivorans]
MRVLLLRHGQTDLNVQKRLQGSSDIPLNERGREQARESHEFAKANDLIPTRIISSPLGRAIETGAIFAGIDISSFKEKEISADYKPAEIELDDNLIEMAFGVCEQRNMGEENPAFLHECFDTPAAYRPPEGGESYDEVVARAGAVVESIRSMISSGELKEDDTLLLVSHGALSHAIFEYVKKTARENYWDVDFNNCAIAELLIGADRSQDDYRFISDGFEKNW